jgi:hypothetical protein
LKVGSGTLIRALATPFMPMLKLKKRAGQFQLLLSKEKIKTRLLMVMTSTTTHRRRRRQQKKQLPLLRRLPRKRPKRNVWWRQRRLQQRRVPLPLKQKEGWMRWQGKEGQQLR